MNSHAKPRSREEKAKNRGNFLLLNSSATSREKQTSIHLTTNNFDQGTKSPMNIEELSAVVVDCAYKLHVEAGPGLLETVYEVVLAKMKQVLTYLRLLNLPLGLLINFGASTFKEGCKRIVRNHKDFASSRLRVNQNPEDITL